MKTAQAIRPSTKQRAHAFRCASERKVEQANIRAELARLYAQAEELQAELRSSPKVERDEFEADIWAKLTEMFASKPNMGGK